MTNFIFCLGTGRSGTYSVFNALSTYDQLKVHHEFLIDDVLKWGTLKHHNIITSKQVIEYLTNYKSALEQTRDNQASIVDISNGLPLILDELKIVFPDAIFIWISRNAYKVTSSFYYKFEELMYPTWGMEKLKQGIKTGNALQFTSDKRVFRPLYSYRDNDRLLNILYHWKVYEEIAIRNREYFDLIYRFEDLVNNVDSSLVNFFHKLGLKLTDEAKHFFRNPTNIHTRKNHKFSSSEESHYMNICGDINLKLGYNNEGYEVKY